MSQLKTRRQGKHLTMREVPQEEYGPDIYPCRCKQKCNKDDKERS